MAQSHEVTLTLLSTGTVVDVWDRYSIVQDMLSPGNAWTFSFWRSQTRNATWDVVKHEVRFGARVLVSIDGAPQLTGAIGRFRFHNGRDGAACVISGRDLAGPAITWDADPHVTLRNTTAEDAIRALLEPFGIPLSIGVDAAAAREAQANVRRGTRGVTTRTRRRVLDQVHPRPGEKVWQLIDRMVRKLGLLAWIAPDSNGQLAVIIDSPVSAGAPDYQFRWELGDDGITVARTNILEGDWDVDYDTVPTSVSVVAHATRGDSLPARTEVTILNDATSSHRFAATDPPPAPHPRYIESRHARSHDHARSEARRLIAEANADFEKYTCKVQGHSQRSPNFAGADILYTVNSVAHVRDDIPGIDKDMIVRRVEFNGSRGDGQTTTLMMSPLGSIEIVPEE